MMVSETGLFASQDIRTLHVRKCKLEVKYCGIPWTGSSMGFKLVLWAHSLPLLDLFEFLSICL